MSTLTPNYGLIVPEATDTVEQVRADYATNLGKIDNIGGGGSGGHTIVDESGVNLPSESKLQFTDGLQAVDDNVNGKTVVSLAYFAVVNGELCQVYDDGN
jgi:hypothetical protein